MSARSVAFVAVVLAVAGLWLVVRSPEPPGESVAAARSREGRVEVAGIDAPIDILRDRRWVPHVLAGSELDAYFGLGFVHARDRGGQLLRWRRAAEGRSAEVDGPAALAADRLVRTLGLGALAEDEAGRLGGFARSRLEAYAAGVNAGLPPRGPDAPAEAPWSVRDSLAVVKLFAWGLDGALDAILVLDDAIAELGSARALPFFPGNAGEIPPLPRIATHSLPSRPVAERSGFRDPVRALLGLDAPGIGSSGFLVAGALSRSGAPILVADAHLPPQAPLLYHEAHVSGGSLEIAGASLPGAPVFWIGHGRRVAWAALQAPVSVVDVFVETLDPDDPTRFRERGRWKDTSERTERFDVRGQSPVRLVVRATPRGPLLGGVLPTAREPLSLSWPGAVPGNGIESLLRMALASDAAGLRRALARHHEPALWFLYADREGQGGVQLAGFVPDRPQPSGWVPVQAAVGRDWAGRVPFSALPHRRLGRGHPWIVVADDAANDGGSAPLEWWWQPGARAERLRALLDRVPRGRPLDLRAAASLAFDVRSPRAGRIVSSVLALAGDLSGPYKQERQAAGLLESWDLESAAGSAGAALYHVLMNGLAVELLGQTLGEDLFERYVRLPSANPIALVENLLIDADERFTGDDRTAVRDVVRRALRESWLWLGVHQGNNPARWRWGAIHSISFAPIGSAASGDRAGLGPFPIGGDRHTVSAGWYDPTRPFAVETASLYRFALDLGEIDKALTLLAPGQTEQPDDPHYADRIEAWLAARPGLLLTSRVILEDDPAARLRLEPGP